MADIKIRDSAIREWASAHQLPVGTRGPLPRHVIEKYSYFQSLPLLEQIAHFKQQLVQANAELSENKAVIRSLQARVRDLEEQVAMWRDLAVVDNMIAYSD